jgi:signal transduction histidine kinase
MPENPVYPSETHKAKPRGDVALWLSGAWILPVLVVSLWFMPPNASARLLLLMLALVCAPLPAVWLLRRQRQRLIEKLATAEEAAERLKLQLDTVRFRTSRLREELSAADKQARLAHQLTLLGQFTAGFMHEFNNPLAIVAGRLEVLLEERKDDAALCADLDRMLQETRYMGNVARTLLQALRRERGSEVFDPATPGKALSEAVAAFRVTAERQDAQLIEEIGDAPRVDIPEHVIAEVVRGLLSNAFKALEGHKPATVWARLDGYRSAGTKVVLRIEDNGPGVPEAIREHLFEPFVTQSSGRERLGLGLFLAASLLDMYDGRIRYETREGGGASFILELPPARFTHGQPYHWFAGGGAD